MIKRDTGDTCRYKVYIVQGTIWGSWEKAGYRDDTGYTIVWDTEDTGYTIVQDIRGFGMYTKDVSVGTGIHNRFTYIIVSLVYKRYVKGCKRVQEYK